MPRSYTFTVEGTGMFPVDMLRYDNCWPRTEQDDSPEVLAAPPRTKDPKVAQQARRILQALDSDDALRREVLHQLLGQDRLWDKPRKVTLTGNYAPNEEHWESHGWKVVSKVEKT